MTVKEVADKLGISVQAVRKHCRKCDGSLDAKMVKVGPRQTRTWVITGGTLLSPRVDPAESCNPEILDEPGCDVDEAPSGAASSPESESSEGPSIDEQEERWRRVLEDVQDGPEDRVDHGETRESFISSDKLLKLIKGKMPEDMFKRNEFLIEVWCELAPPYLNIDVEKLGKWGVYGIPPIIILSEVSHARDEQKKKAVPQ
jgi:hypothetical protein